MNNENKAPRVKIHEFIIVGLMVLMCGCSAVTRRVEMSGDILTIKNDYGFICHPDGIEKTSRAVSVKVTGMGTPIHNSKDTLFIMYRDFIVIDGLRHLNYGKIILNGIDSRMTDSTVDMIKRAKSMRVAIGYIDDSGEYVGYFSDCYNG